MKIDRYTRVVLTVIATALVYLCVVSTPLPTAHAQRGLRPGDDTGPAQVVVVGWRTPDRVPLQLSEPVTVTGDVRVSGTVQAQQPARTYDRVVLAGWEDGARSDANQGTFRPFNPDARHPNLRGVPVTAYAPQ